VTRRQGQFLHSRAVNVGQTFPPVAVLTVAVPLWFGQTPTLIALFAAGLCRSSV
jgi:osmoprotectant transport system permease protein